MVLTIVQKALRAQRRAIKRLDGRRGTITRGSITVAVLLTIGESTTEEIVENNIATETIVRDFFIEKANYNFGAGPVEPVNGDIVTVNGERWQVLPTDSEDGSRRHDRDGLTWRIHTKEIGNA